MEFVVISGCSGSGKSTALHQLEDEGYYCIDNIPIGLISDLVREARDGCFRNYRGVAVCIDLRTVTMKRTPFKDLVDQLALAEKTRVLFLSLLYNRRFYSSLYFGLFCQAPLNFIC